MHVWLNLKNLLNKISHQFLVATKLFAKWNLHIKDHLHWRSLLAKPLATVTHYSHATVKWQSLLYLPWPPLAAQQKIEMILPVLRHPRWPRQVQWWLSRVTVTGIVMLKLCQCKDSFIADKSIIELQQGYLQVFDVLDCRFDVVGQNVVRQVVSAPKKDSISLLQQNASKSINNCLNMIIYSY
jgi:hypothetical protein